MITKYWNLDTGLVTAQPVTQNATAIQSERGEQDIQVILLQGVPAVAVQLPETLNVGIVVRDPANLKTGYLAGPDLLTRGATAADGYTGTTSTDTTLTRTTMHVDPSDPTPESTSYLAKAAFFQVLEAGGDESESLPFAWTILPNYYRPLQPPADVAVDYPPANQVDTITARNAAIAAAALDTSAASLQPFPLWLQYGGRLTRISGGYSGITLDLAGKGFTYASPDEIVAWLTEAVYFIQPNLGSAPLVIDLSYNALPNTEDILDAIATAITQPPFTDYAGGFIVYLQGGTNVAPTPATAHQDATLVLQLPDPTPDNAGVVLSGDGGGFTVTITYDAGIALAASSGTSSGGDSTYTLGVSDSPTMEAAVTKLNALLVTYPSTYLGYLGIGSFAANGTASGIDTAEGDYPVNATGPAVVSNNPGVVAVPNASIAAIQAYNGSDAQTN